MLGVGGARSAPGAGGATLTAAGVARGGVEAAADSVEKRPGYGRKRERLEARLRGLGNSSSTAVLFSILAALQDFAAPNALTDDTSLVVVRRGPLAI